MDRRRLSLEDFDSIELAHDSSFYRDPLIWKERTRAPIARLIVGYITHDNDCEDPLKSCDGMGRLLTRDDKFEHVGRNRQGEPEIEEFYVLVCRLRGIDPNDHDQGDEIDAVAVEMWKEACARGKKGTPYAVPVSVGYHGEIAAVAYDLEAMIEAVWIPDESCLAHINEVPEDERAARAKECFEQARDEYNTWVRGECFGVIVEHFDLDKAEGVATAIDKLQEACWGYVGEDYADSALQDDFKREKKYYLLSKKSCKTSKKGARSCHPNAPSPSEP